MDPLNIYMNAQYEMQRGHSYALQRSGYPEGFAQKEREE